MKKPSTLREHLLLRTPWLNNDPTRLAIFVENGHIVAKGGGAAFTAKTPLCYEHQYRLTLVVLEFPGDPEEINIPVLEWLSTNQPDLLHNAEWQKNGIAFQSEVIDKGKVDYSLSLELTERIIAHVKDDSAQESSERYQVESADEPQFEDLEAKLMRKIAGEP